MILSSNIHLHLKLNYFVVFPQLTCFHNCIYELSFIIYTHIHVLVQMYSNIHSFHLCVLLCKLCICVVICYHIYSNSIHILECVCFGFFLNGRAVYEL